MRKLFILTMFAFLFITVANAQTDLENTLKKHVYTLADPSMKGRTAGSIYSEKARQYIQKELESCGLTVTNYEVVSDSLFANNDDEDLVEEVVEEVVAEDTKAEPKIYKNIYTVVPAGAKDKTDEYITIVADFTGYGTDTIQGYELIKYSADKYASSVAVAIELAKKFNARKHELKRSIIFLFTEDCTNDNVEYLERNTFKENKVAFILGQLGYQSKDSTGAYLEDIENIEYAYNNRFKNFSSLIQPIVLPDVSINTSVEDRYYYNNIIRISSQSYYDNYSDTAGNLDYPMMAKLTDQIEKVVYAVDTVKNIEIEKKTDDDIDYYDSYSAFTKRYKKKSYFGLNFMWGSNQHDYQEGYMTGKDSYALSAGVFYKWQFASALALKIDANYERAYAKRADGKFRSDVISVPLTLMLSTPGTSLFGMDFGVGVYYDYMFAGQIQHKDIDFDIFNRHEIGINWELSLRFSHFIISWQYKHSYTDKMHKDYFPDGKILENTHFLKLGWRF